MSIFAFTRGPRVRAGYVFGGPVPTNLEVWLDGRHARNFPLTAANFKIYVGSERQLYRGIPMPRPVTRPPTQVYNPKLNPRRGATVNTTRPRQRYKAAPLKGPGPTINTAPARRRYDQSVIVSVVASGLRRTLTISAVITLTSCRNGQTLAIVAQCVAETSGVRPILLYVQIEGAERQMLSEIESWEAVQECVLRVRT